MVIEEKHEQKIKERFVCKGRDLWDVQRNCIAGQVNENGYRIVSVYKKQIRAHRIVWFLTTGKWPDEFLDHKDRDRLNNSFENLREATRSQNMFNSKYSSNTSGCKNVSWCKTHKKWMVRITANKKLVFCKAFKSFEEAKAVAEQVTLQFHGEFART